MWTLPGRLAATALAASVAALTVIAVGLSAPASAATLFSDDFADGDSAGWSSTGGTWSVVTDGSPVLRQSGTSSDARSRAGSASWTDYAVTARIKPTAVNGGNRFVALLARAQSNTNYYYLALRSNSTVELKKLVGGSSTTLASAPAAFALGTWHTLALEVAGTSLRGTVDGVSLVTATDAQFASGQIGVATFNAAANIDNVLVTSGAPSSPSPSPSSSAAPSASPSASRSPSASPSPSGPPIPPLPGGPDGFATVAGYGTATTTGGAGGPTVTVSTTAAFLDYIARPGPYTIQVAGTITLPTGTTDGMHSVSSDKTIVGLGSTGRLTGGGLNVGIPVSDAVTTPPADAVHNVIIRNLTIDNSTDDLINVQMFSHHVWIDHNDLSRGGDGAVDIKRGSDLLTVSWNRFHDHYKTTLVGHDDANGAQDTGRLRVTYHHNFFDRSDQRNPRVRFSPLVHVYNNYYFDNSYGIASTNESGLFVEGNYFFSVNNPGRVEFSGPLGRMVERNNILVECNHPIEVRGSVPDPAGFYGYTVDPPASVPTLVPAGAGVGKVTS
ncbi:pectate lyase [Allocatelliglobosispora scoriae]|uniref:Pectate lyase n=1 Tax=Allocatelliglobosispora scoriae TaxID=643052 RepID=A0A841BIL6_9ACTN|nr:LamG-like jellyroll fold domain-containing protein [Allocatelliglobosispora scoriae]MBB5866903.1 pectate lyase [Allocatelliglobosispora scoriae]